MGSDTKQASRGKFARPEDGKKKAEKVDESWKNGLVKTGKSYAACLSNLITILVNEPGWKGVLAYDEFTAQVVKLKDPPWHDDDRPKGKLTGSWVDGDAVRAAAWITREWEDIKPSDALVERAVQVVAEKNKVHPVRDWLNGLEWDGKERLDTWLVRLAGAEDTLYTRAVGIMFMLGAVARVMQPGCKVDHTLVLEGKTGRGKSTLLRTLTGEEWFLETEIELGSKDFYQSLHGKWIIELAELDSLNRGDLSRVKAVLTKRVDTYRESYGRHRKDFPRQCVFTGTTEEDAYLKDEKGNRRFWPVLTSEIKIPLIERERDQLWAEAVFRFKKGEHWHITDRSLLGLFESEQEWRRQHDPWEMLIANWIPEHPRRWREGTTTTDILENAIGMQKEKMGRLEQIRVGSILRKQGWERKRERDMGGDLSWIFRPTAAALKVLEAKKKARDTEAVKELAEAVEKGRGKVVPITDHLEKKGSPKSKSDRPGPQDKKPRKN